MPFKSKGGEREKARTEEGKEKKKEKPSKNSPQYSPYSPHPFPDP